MKNQPLVSILVTSFNYEQFIEDAIDSALNQTYSPIEVIVVDDGSTDNSREIITGYGERIIPIFKENGGAASAINAGFNVSSGEIICLLDSDDVFLPEKVSEVVRVFSSDPEIGWYFHRMKAMDLEKGNIIRITPGSRTGKCDIRKDIKRGRISIGTPETSGLCFSRWLFEMFVPLPWHEKHRISDKFFKIAAFSLAKGYFGDEPLAILRVHPGNRYTGIKIEDKLPRLAKIHINNAYWLRKKWPELARISNKSFAKGIGVFWKIRGIDPQYKQLVNEYLSEISYLEKIEVFLIAAAYKYIWRPERRIFVPDN